MTALPIDAFEGEFHRLIEQGPVVITAPTGTGKSTQVPRWAARRGPVLVVEPRRVACQALAQRVAALEAQGDGYEVGFVVRDERTASETTDIVFATPGVVLRLLAENGLSRFSTVIVDEFHERSLDVDLILALCVSRPGARSVRSLGGVRLVVMSATVAGARVARYVKGAHLAVEGDAFPVRVEYLPGDATYPESRDLDRRLLAALEQAADEGGDVLVFLPGKGEIERTTPLVKARTPFHPLPLHGELSLKAQRAVLSGAGERRAILATNVAETSLTVPGITAVIDSGLVRRTHYRAGRGYLGLAAIGADSAEQRRGRAGRLGPGVCYRLWARGAQLEAATPPEIRRESLVPLILAAAACGVPDLSLSFLDPPAEYAVADARAVLLGLDALDETGGITPLGEELFHLPIDAHLGRLLIEARARGTLELAVPLVVALAGSRRLHTRGERDVGGDWSSGVEDCDARAIIEAVRSASPSDPGIDAGALREARTLLKRLEGLWPEARGSTKGRSPMAFDRFALAGTLLAAWPGCAYVARRRGRRVAWSNGGTEVELARASRIDEEKVEAIIGLDLRAISGGKSKNALLITQAMPIPVAWLDEFGLTRVRARGARLRKGAIVVEGQAIYAGKVIASREQIPAGATLREAICDLFLDRQIYPDVLDAVRDRYELHALEANLAGRSFEGFREWLLGHLDALGVDTEEDRACLEGGDLMPEPLPDALRAELERTYPRRLSVGNTRYDIRYDVPGRVATLIQVAGEAKDPPAAGFLPRLPGWRIDWEYKNRTRRLRG